MPQEFIHHFGKNKREKGYMIVKLDLEKSYDRVDWNFLCETLVMYGFPNTIVKLIMHGICSSNISFMEW